MGSVPDTVHVRFDPRVSTRWTLSPTWRRRIHPSSAMGRTVNGSSSSAVESADVRTTSAGATTTPSRSRRGLTFTTAGPGSIGPVRSFGPARSIATTGGVPSGRRAARACSAMRRHESASSWAQLMRATSIPLDAISATMSSSSAASLGIVTMIRVVRVDGDGPSRRSAFASNRSRPSAMLMTSRPRSPAPSPERPFSITRMSRTASTVASTADSDRPSEERPSEPSRACRSRTSWRRSSR